MSGDKSPFHSSRGFERKRPLSVSHLKLSDSYKPHWTGWEAKMQGVVVTGSEPRLYLVKLDPATGTLAMDEAFSITPLLQGRTATAS
jgi:hypothetical protein